MEEYFYQENIQIQTIIYMVVLKKKKQLIEHFMLGGPKEKSQADWNTETAKKEIPQTVLSKKKVLKQEKVK